MPMRHTPTSGTSSAVYLSKWWYLTLRVGAALLMPSGEVVTGCNVENASYGTFKPDYIVCHCRARPLQ